MKINCHTHIFTLRTILTQGTIDAIENRLRASGWPEIIIEAVVNFITDLYEKPRYLNEEELLKLFIKQLTGTKRFKNFSNNIETKIPILKTIDFGSEEITTAAAREVLDQLSSWMEANENAQKKLFNIYQTLRIALSTDSTEIAKKFLNHLDKDDALVALMMDIRGEDETEDDMLKFHRQIQELQEASLQLPGRVFPFFSVNPHRPDHFDLMKNALEKRGFVGVKLYPSIGYKVNHPSLIKVYDYCLENDIPLLMHCNHGGFYSKKEYTKYCNPENWKEILKDRNNLTLCFAHFGGEDSIYELIDNDTDTWSHKIIDLMKKYPNIYADISYHQEMMHDDERENKYFKKLHSLLEDPIIGERILFGTDSWLLQQDISDELYWNYYKKKLSGAAFNKITQENPKRFLGLPTSQLPLKKNIRSFIDFQKNNRKKVGSLPNEWLRSEVETDFEVNRDHPLWTNKKRPAWIVFSVLKKQYPKIQQKRGLKNNRETLVRDAGFWNYKDVDEDLFSDNSKSLALRMVKSAIVNNGELRGNLKKEDARKILDKMLKNNDTRLIDLALQVDAMFTFKDN